MPDGLPCVAKKVIRHPIKKCNIRSEDDEWHRVKNIWNLYQGSYRRKV